MAGKSQKSILVAVCVILAVGFATVIFLPFPPPASSFPVKPVILYYDYENLPFNASQFPTIVKTTLDHGFNTLMLLVYFNNRPIFNQTMLRYLYSYAASMNLTLVPSYYIESLSDKFNVSDFAWINLDMERIEPRLQGFFYAKIRSQMSGIISVTSPFGQPVEFSPSLDIVETYSATPWFWFDQLSYWHANHICSIGSWELHGEAEYQAEKDYCLKYTDGVMVFDYYNFLKSDLN
jgi:hypothetical protein